MSVQDLLLQYQNTPRLFQLTDRLSFSQPQKIYLKNLLGSSSQFVVASVFTHPSCSQLNHLIILNDAEQAAYFHNTLESLTEGTRYFLLPFFFQEQKNYSILNSSHVMLRTEALTKVAGFIPSPSGEGMGLRTKKFLLLILRACLKSGRSR